jgi:hypothetical protein
MTQDELQTIVASFYQKALTVNTDTNPGAVLDKILADSFQSINSQEVKDKATLIKQVGFFWQIIPDLVWEPQDLVIGVDGKKVVVRSVATGSPRATSWGCRLTAADPSGSTPPTSMRSSMARSFACITSKTGRPV